MYYDQMPVVTPSILYVDDEAGNRVVFEQNLGEKFSIKTASSGEAALEILANEPIGVLVSDQCMPGMSGNELLAKAKLLYPLIVRIVITAYGDLDPILKAVNDGLVARYLVKPWSLPELEDMLTWALEVHQIGQNGSAVQERLLTAERLALLGSMQAAISHDMQQPLTYMHSNIERLRQFKQMLPAIDQTMRNHLPASHNVPLWNDFIEEYTDIVDDLAIGCKHLTSVGQSLRRILRGNSQTNDDSSCDPLAAIRFTERVCRQSDAGQRASLVCHQAQSLPHVAINGAELAQVLINLTSNALQSIVGDRKQRGKVEISSVPVEDHLKITITDNGPGIPPNVLKNIGTPFLTTRKEGSGLGVFQCQRIVHGAGGVLKIDSEVDCGTTATVTIPLATTEESP